jgi:3-hydroxymyristoyl/3-hydroxydecanoyl-(acyl carrier protein) dehydratase
VKAMGVTIDIRGARMYCLLLVAYVNKYRKMKNHMVYDTIKPNTSYILCYISGEGVMKAMTCGA